MGFSFNDVFKSLLGEDEQSKEEKEYINNLEENVYHSQKMFSIGSWTHFIIEGENFFSDEIYNIFECKEKDEKDSFSNFNEYFHPEDESFVLNNVKALLKGKDYDIKYRIITSKGTVKYLHEKTKTIYDENNNPVKIIGVMQDIKDELNNKLEDKKIYNDSSYDIITGLKNKRYFLKELDMLKEDLDLYNDKYGLIIMEVDGIRNVSFSLGDKLGKKLTMEVASRFKSIFPNNEYICKYSESHFIVIVKGGKDDKLYKNIAEDIIKKFSQPFKIDRYELIVTVNIGICVFPKETKDSLPLKNSAKIALINSKKQGKNKYVIYSSQLNIEYYKEFTLRSDIYNAIEKDQLEIYYQPIINLKTNEIMCAEVLIRWNHPEWGVVPPREFISIAEETELIIDIGKWVLKEVCKNYRKWIKKGLTNIKMSVNFSSIQFYEKDFVDNIKDIIKGYNLDSKFLIMEIKENIFLKNENKVCKDVKRLRNMGIQIALDNFGTGFSSLSHLNPKSINILKLDKSFTGKIPLDRTSNIITKAAIKLAKELKIKFVAKGIENLEQLSYLKNLNCFAGQGHIYSGAVPLKQFEKLLLKKKCKPLIVDSSMNKIKKDRRRFFRIDFLNLLETNLTIMEIEGKSVNVGNTKVLVKNIGPGGLCFISNIRFPVEKKILLKFTTNLMEKEMLLYGCPVWTEELDNKLYKYGVEFRIDSSHREDLFKDLSKVQIKMRNNILFDEGSFISLSYERYFK